MTNRSAAIGAFTWMALAVMSAAGVEALGLLELLFLLAAWVIVPLGIRFLPDSPLVRVVQRLQPIAAASATVSFFWTAGRGAAAAAIPWLTIDVLLALAGLAGLKRAFRGGIPDLLLAAAMMLPTVGGVHLVASRWGYALGGFPEPIILLTAIHFHYTAFAAPILAALAGRALPKGLSRTAKGAGSGVVASLPMIAAGFIGSPLLKLAGVGFLCASSFALAAAQATVPTRTRGGRLLLILSSGALATALVLAAVYEHGFFTGRSWLSIPQMVRFHGLLNGLGFSLAGLLAWTMETAAAARHAATKHSQVY